MIARAKGGLHEKAIVPDIAVCNPAGGSTRSCAECLYTRQDAMGTGSALYSSRSATGRARRRPDDPSMHHYAMASGDTVVQIHGMSPVQFAYVNPNDDPSKKK
jgi:hypothetical protein